MATLFETPRAAGRGWGWILLYGIVSVLLGLFSLAWPFAATYAATLVVGAFLVAAGVVSLASGAMGHGHEGRVYAIVFGILSIVLGAVIALEPTAGAISLTLLIAAWLGARGVLELAFGRRLRRGRGLMIALGIVNLVLAFYVLWALPWSAMTLPGYIVAISFLLGGATAIASALAHRAGEPAFAAPETLQP